MLPSDELGEKGESRFREICADARLICNKADRDRTGWDFIVEFPFDLGTEPPLDSRATPLSCHVQVKTVKSGSDIVKLRLSAAERLAKEVKPAFIYVFTVTENLSFAESYLLHVLDDRLAQILKRLRKETAIGDQEKVNKKFISFSCNWKELLQPTGSALRDALMSKCTEGMHKYAAVKKMQLENLGFETAKYHGSMTFEGLEEDELLDVFLGLRKDVPLANFEVFQTRFGIKLVDLLPTPATITLTPHSTKKCTLLVRDNDLADPTVIRADILGASLPGNNKVGRIRLNAPLFSATINFTDGGEDALTIDYDLHLAPKTTVGNFENFWRMLRTFSSGTGSLELKIDGLPDGVDLPIQPTRGLPSVAYCTSAISYYTNVGSLIRRAGDSTDPEFTYDELVACHFEIWELNEMLSKPQFLLSLGSDAATETIATNPGEQMIFAKIFLIGNLRIAYYGVGRFLTKKQDTKTRWESTDFVLKSIRIIASLEHYERFVKEAHLNENISSGFRLYPGDDR